MSNIINSIGFDLERVHTGLIAYLVDFRLEDGQKPLKIFFRELGVDLQEARQIEVKKEYENIDLVLFDQSNTPLVALEMKVHNHESCVAVKGTGGEKAFQTETYPNRVKNCKFLYVTLGLGESYRRQPYGNVEQIGLERFLKAVRKVSGFDPVIDAWEQSLSEEWDFRTACKKGRRKGGEDEKKWNVYFLGFLRERLDRLKLVSDKFDKVDFTTYRHSQDTILNVGIEKFLEAEGPYCYMEINGNGKLNLKANLESLTRQEEKRDYVNRAKNHYIGLTNRQWLCKPTGDVTNLTKSRMLLSFDAGIEKQDGFFRYTKSEEWSCERISEIVRWFLEIPAV